MLVDESTELSSMKTLAVVIRYFCGTRVRDRFLGLLEALDLTAEGLYGSLMACLEKNYIPINQMIGIAADNANVMIGDKGGLRAKLSETNKFICDGLRLPLLRLVFGTSMCRAAK